MNFSYGEGVHLITENGTKYLDFFSGLAVNALGYNHPAINNAIKKQIERFIHLSNYFVADVQIMFAQKIAGISGMSKVFLTNSGTEAVEAAVKLIRKIKGPDKTIFSLSHSFHGRTYGALSLTDRGKYKAGFQPLPPNTDIIIFNDINDLQKKITSNTAAVFIEFIQGEGGINEASKDFINKLFELKDHIGFAIAADEIQTGIGRTGEPFAFNHYNVEPDILLVAKSVGGGLPLGAILTKREYDNAFTPGSHGSTFGGNPVSCAAGLAVLNEIFETDLLSNVNRNGKYFINQLKEIQKMFPEYIKDVRGKGFMIGVELSRDCSTVVTELRKRNVLANCTNECVLRILPPLIATKTDIDFFLYNFHETLKTL